VGFFTSARYAAVSDRTIYWGKHSCGSFAQADKFAKLSTFKDGDNMAGAADSQKTLEDLLKQQEELAAKIEAQRQASRADALDTVRKLCKSYEFTATDLKGHLKVMRTKSASPARKRSTRKK
jgi:hypothetical protein